MSTKPVFEKIAKIQRPYVPLCGHATFVLLTPTRIVTAVDKIMYPIERMEGTIPGRHTRVGKLTNIHMKPGLPS